MRQEAEPRDHPTGAVVFLVASVLLFAGFDVLYTVLGSRTTGPAGPWAGLALRLVLDLAVLAILRAPILVTWLTIAGEGYVSNALDKLGCTNRTQLGLLAREAGLGGS